MFKHLTPNLSKKETISKKYILENTDSLLTITRRSLAHTNKNACSGGRYRRLPVVIRNCGDLPANVGIYWRMSGFIEDCRELSDLTENCQN